MWFVELVALDSCLTCMFPVFLCTKVVSESIASIGKESHSTCDRLISFWSKDCVHIHSAIPTSSGYSEVRMLGSRFWLSGMYHLSSAARVQQFALLQTLCGTVSWWCDPIFFYCPINFFNCRRVNLGLLAGLVYTFLSAERASVRNSVGN